MWRKPNYFFAFQVNSSSVYNSVQKLQEEIVEKEPLLKSALIKIPTLHVTLSVMHLSSANEVSEIGDKVSEWGEKNFNLYFPNTVTVTFAGIGNFSKRVGYIKLVEDDNYDQLCGLAKAMQAMLEDVGHSQAKSFTPHLTFLKLRKTLSTSLTKKFSETFNNLSNLNTVFGSQEINYIQLLSMSEKDGKGYYKCYKEIPIPLSPVIKNNSSCSTPPIKKNEVDQLCRSIRKEKVKVRKKICLASESFFKKQHD